MPALTFGVDRLRPARRSDRHRPAAVPPNGNPGVTTCRTCGYRLHLRNGSVWMHYPGRLILERGEPVA
jgi:hypothetical protein